MSAYSERLKHPMWQRKRLEILERDEFRCTGCGADDRQLHVHHLFYSKGREPWDYPSLSLTTLCHECHDVAHGEGREGNEAAIHALRSLGVRDEGMWQLGLSLSMVTHEGMRAMTQTEWDTITTCMALLIQFVQVGGDPETVADELSRKRRALEAAQE